MFANPAAAGLLGVESVEDVTGAARGTLMARFDVFDEHGRPLSLADLPATGGAARRTPGADARSQRDPRDRAGALAAEQGHAGVRPSGEVSLVVSVIEDLTEVKRAELSQRLLAQAGKELASSLDYEQTLQRVVTLAVPDLADWGAIVMRGDGDALRQVAAAHVDPAEGRRCCTSSAAATRRV